MPRAVEENELLLNSVAYLWNRASWSKGRAAKDNESAKRTDWLLERVVEGRVLWRGARCRRKRVGEVAEFDELRKRAGREGHLFRGTRFRRGQVVAEAVNDGGELPEKTNRKRGGAFGRDDSPMRLGG